MNAAFLAGQMVQDQTVPVNFDRLHRVIDRLTEILEQETTLVREMRVKEIQPLQNEKNRLSEDYVKLQNALRNDPAKLAELDPESRAALHERLSGFHAIVERNMRTLKAGIDAGERIFKNIKTAVQAKRAESGGYTEAGGYGAHQTSRGPTVSVAVNREI